MPRPKLLDDHVRFRLADPQRRLASVRLDCDPVIAGARDFTLHPGPADPADGPGPEWLLDLPRPAVHRLEYRLDVAAGDSSALLLDPDNPCTVPTAFGERSVLELPRYAVPGWVGEEAPPGRRHELTVGGEHEERVPVTVWEPAGTEPGERLPLLFVHDGPEYDRLASVTHHSAVMIARGVLPRHRVALANPVLRDAWYSGSPRYLRTVTHSGMRELSAVHPVSTPVAVMGASLGGLTSLLVGLLGAPEIGVVLAQSGSFFQPRTDPQESGFRYFDRIARRVQEVLDARHADHPLVVGMTCGHLEENAPNNRAMARALARAGHDVSYAEVPDLHNYTAWRDAIEPTLTGVLRAAWSQ